MAIITAAYDPLTGDFLTYYISYMVRPYYNDAYRWTSRGMPVGFPVTSEVIFWSGVGGNLRAHVPAAPSGGPSGSSGAEGKTKH